MSSTITFETDNLDFENENDMRQKSPKADFDNLTYVFHKNK